jgi:hypothetical protein
MDDISFFFDVAAASRTGCGKTGVRVRQTGRVILLLPEYRTLAG